MVFKNQSVQTLNKNQEAKETDASTASERDNGSPSPLDNTDIQTAIVMDEKKGYQTWT